MHTRTDNGRYQKSKYVVKKLYLLNSLNFLPMSLKSMPKSFDLTCKNGYYPHFSTRSTFSNVGPYPLYLWADYMLGDDRVQFMEWYEEQKDKSSAISRSCWPTAWTM